jgi:hypothetical protein
MAANEHRKYITAREVAEREGVKFTSKYAAAHTVYLVMRLLGYRWTPQAQEWTRWHQPYVVLGEAS